ncbi:MAG: hypothetical protein H7Z21_16260 [Hymenobacter sp.]|nr:hypothetical protein [Hymenobacter sp.]
MSDGKGYQAVNNNAKWADVRSRFLINFPPNFHPNKAVEMLALCRTSQRLRQLVPFISLGRLGLERYEAYERGHADNFVCLYFYDSYYVVSDSSNEEKRFFDTAEAAISFVKLHLDDENPFQ